MTLNDYLTKVGVTGTQTALVVGGLILAFFGQEMMPPTQNKMGLPLSKIVVYGGLAAAAAGGVWMVTTGFGKKPQAAATFAHPGGYYEPVESNVYPDPLNNFRNVKPKNRLDLQTNYILNEKNANFDNYVNNIILTQAKDMGLNLLDTNNFPERVDPWKIPQLNPTTQIEPSRDTNTVKMIA